MSAEAEASVLGACLLASDAYWRAAHHIPCSEAFHVEANRVVWETFSELKAEGIELDAVTVMEKLLYKKYDMVQ